MLSIGKLTGGADSARYYEQTVATGREDYYSGRGESAGQWVGDGAQALGIEGNIGEGQLQALLVDARHPVTGDLLRAVGGTSVQGFDLTFSAPKSVSVLFAAGDEDVRRAVTRAHDTAVLDALGYLEREAVQVRRGKGGVFKEHAGGLIAGAYRHRTSRAGDPQMHTHVVAANLAQGADGRWTALHGAALYSHAKTASYLYQAALREQLTIELGIEWGPVVKGIADVRGVPREVIEHFSQRRAEIVDAMAQAGGRSARAAQVAALQTRRAKDYGVQESSIYERWQARAAEHGLTPDVVAQVVGRDVGPTREDFVQSAAALMSGESGLTAHASTFTRREALQAWAELHAAGASAVRIEELTDRWLASDLVVRVDGEVPVGRNEVISTRRGMRVADVEERFTTPGMLATERALIDDAQRRVGEGAAVARGEVVEAAIAARPYLAEEQRAMVRSLTSSGDGVQVVLAKAGAGKTTALDAAREAWERSGVIVQGTALGSYATKELRDSGVASTTVARLLIDIEQHGLPPGSVLIVDEAGMVGTRTLASLAGAAQASRVKLVLVGDDRQLPEIDAGGAFRGLAQRLGAVELHDNRRQHDPEDRRALDAHRSGRPEELVESLRRRGRIAVSTDVEQTRQALVSDWWDGAQIEGIENVAMIAMRRSEVRELNELARGRMRDAGRLANHELVVDERAFAVGDRIVTRTNAPRLGVVNGSRGTIAAIHQDHSIAVRLDEGDRVLLPSDYVTGWRDHTPNVDHGYAITANGIQGGTVQRSYVLASEDAYQEWGYVAASRHRVETRFYVTVPDVPADEQLLLDQTDAPDPLSGLIHALGHSRAKELAIDVAEQGDLHAMPDDRLHSEAAQLRELLTTAPGRGSVEVDRLDAEISHARHQGEQARERLAVTEQRIKEARRRDREPLRHARDGQQRAMATWQQRVDELQAERADVVARHSDPDRWLADHHGEASRLAAVERELARRHAIHRHEGLRMVVVDPPAYVTDELGPRPPDDLRGQRAWDRGARTIESYRQRNGATTNLTERGLGSRPSDPAAARAYFAASRRLRAAQVELGHVQEIDIGVTRGPEL